MPINKNDIVNVVHIAVSRRLLTFLRDNSKICKKKIHLEEKLIPEANS